MCSLREGKERKVPVVHNKSCDMYDKSHRGRFKCWQCNQRYSTKKLLSLHGRGIHILQYHTALFHQICFTGR